MGAVKRCGIWLAFFLGIVPAAAQDMHGPRVTRSTVDWAAAASSVTDASGGPDDVFASLNKAFGARFPGIEKSTVPVLLPADVAGMRRDHAAGAADVATSIKYFGDFYPSKFFLAGPAGYDATFWINTREAGLRLNYPKPVEIEIGGASYTYDLDEPNHQEVFPPSKDLAEKFPGMRRILRENHVRYAFERFGVPYVMSIQCYDWRSSRRHLTCREADQVALRFLNRLQTAGGTPARDVPEPLVDLKRPDQQSPDFTYYGPGDLIPNTGWRKMPGRADYTVYARLRFPFAQAPAYIKSQSFMHWGDCYRTGRVGRVGRKDASYRCRVNDKPLVFNEAASENWTYPWRDNFCEMRDFLVGQCPGGYGHQGQDMRPSNCVLFNKDGDRCQPYQHTLAAVRDGPVWRAPGNLGLYIVLNTANEHVRVRYLHMNPRMMDADGMVSGRQVSEGEILGKVATWGDKERGTSYHLHFNLQVFTKSGWVWVNPYMTLVASYEHLIGGRGREIKPGDPPPVIPDKPPVVLNKEPAAQPSANTEPDSAPLVKSEEKFSIKSEKPRKKHRRHRRRRRHSEEE